MNISTTAIHAASTPQPQAASTKTQIDQMGPLDFSHLFEELDLDGDGEISDQEFDLYRAGKAASGEYIPADGPDDANSERHSTNELTESLFREVLENRRSDS